MLYYISMHTEAYRSGHNGTDSKSFVPHGTVGSNPTASARKTDKFRLVGFSTKSTLADGSNIALQCEIRLDGEWVDLIFYQRREPLISP